MVVPLAQHVEQVAHRLGAEQIARREGRLVQGQDVETADRVLDDRLLQRHRSGQNLHQAHGRGLFQQAFERVPA